MKLWLKTIVLVLVLITGCVVSFYASDGTVVGLLIVGIIMYVLSQS